MKANVIVKPKEAVLDPQGNAVRDAMRHLGMPEVRNVRIGKYMEIDIDGKDADLEKRLHTLCRDLLSNPVIEDYELKTSETRGRRPEGGGQTKTSNVQRPTPNAKLQKRKSGRRTSAKSKSRRARIRKKK
jgi:phosphoribosylformylglycinamidine synthase PurS subunit